MAQRSRWSRRPEDGLIRGNPRLVETALTVVTLGLTALAGVFLVAGLELARLNGSLQLAGTGRWLPWLALVAALAVGGGGAWRGHRRDRATAPWAFAGLLIWIAGAVLTLAQR